MAETIPTIPAGMSAEWEITIKNADDSAVDPAATEGYAIFLFDSKGKVIKKYSKNAVTGFVNTLTHTGTTIKMLWEGSHTKEFSGEVYWQYMQQTQNEDFITDNHFTAKTLKKRLCIVEDTESKFTTSIY